MACQSVTNYQLNKSKLPYGPNLNFKAASLPFDRLRTPELVETFPVEGFLFCGTATERRGYNSKCVHREIRFKKSHLQTDFCAYLDITTSNFF